MHRVQITDMRFYKVLLNTIEIYQSPMVNSFVSTKAIGRNPSGVETTIHLK